MSSAKSVSTPGRSRSGTETVGRSVARIPVVIWAGGTVFAPAGNRAFVANNKTNDVSVLAAPETGDDADIAREGKASVPDWTEVDRLETELHPNGIAYVER